MTATMPGIVPPFAVIPGAQVERAVRGRQTQIVALVEATYRRHSAGDSVNPPSYFLRFPDRPSARIIALPASIGGPSQVDGLKWISSFPGNVAAGLPRASAVLILNDHDTGYPFACLESSIISATRTAALAASAAAWLSRGRPRLTRVGFFGAGLIARYIHTFLAGTAPEILLASVNIVDDVEHCLKANTSPHLAERLTGSRDFLAGTLDDVMAGRVTVPADRPAVFSPFGLGVLDLAMGKYVYDEVARAGELRVIDEFFHELRRYG